MKYFVFLGLILVPISIWTCPPVTTYARDTVRGTFHFAWYMTKQLSYTFAGFIIIFALMQAYCLLVGYYSHLRRRPHGDNPLPAVNWNRYFHFPRPVPVTASGDNDGEFDFFDFPEISMSEESNAPGHGTPSPSVRRRQRMRSTLVQDTFQAFLTQSQDDIRAALLESIDQQFWTPCPSPTEHRSRSVSRSRVFLTPMSDQLPPDPESDRWLTPPGPPPPEISRASLKMKTNIVHVRHDDIGEESDEPFLPIQDPVEPPETEDNGTLDTDSLYLESVETPLTRNQARVQNPPKITLHQFPRGITKPCLSSDAMFIETFIRLTDIPCDVKCDCNEFNGPWITWDEGTKMVCGVIDCVKLLKEFFPENTNRFTVDGEMFVASWSIRLTLDHLSCCLGAWRWFTENGKELRLYQPGWNDICKDFERLTRTVKHQLWKKGFGNKSCQELCREIVDDFRSLSTSLDNQLPNQFMLGSTPTEIDCTTFGILSQVMWGPHSILKEELRRFPNLVQYCEQTRELLWPDWEHNLAPGPRLNRKKEKITILLDSCAEDDHFDGDYVEQLTSNNSTARFCNQYYKLTPELDNCDSVTIINTPSQMSSSTCQHDPLGFGNGTSDVFCTKCRNSKQPQSSNLSVSIPDGGQSYIDDDFKDMQDISYTSHGGGEEENKESED